MPFVTPCLLCACARVAGFALFWCVIDRSMVRWWGEEQRRGDDARWNKTDQQRQKKRTTQNDETKRNTKHAHVLFPFVVEVCVFPCVLLCALRCRRPTACHAMSGAMEWDAMRCTQKLKQTRQTSVRARLTNCVTTGVLCVALVWLVCGGTPPSRVR